MFGAEIITDELVRSACGGSTADRNFVLKALAGQVRTMIFARLAPVPAQMGALDDLTQQALMDISCAFSTLRQPCVGVLKSTASTIVTRRVADYLRSRTGAGSPPIRSIDSAVRDASASLLVRDLLSDSGVSPGSAASAEEQIERILAELGRLKPIYREVIVLAFFDQLSTAKIAERMDMKVGAASMLLVRAVRVLRRTLTGDSRVGGDHVLKGS